MFIRALLHEQRSITNNSQTILFVLLKLTFILTMERKLWPQIVSRDFSYPAGIDENNRFIRFLTM